MIVYEVGILPMFLLSLEITNPLIMYLSWEF